MIKSLRIWWSCVIGPSVFRVPDDATGLSSEYPSNPLEIVPSLTINTIHAALGILKWTILFWGPWAFRNLGSSGHFILYTKYIVVTMFIYIASVFLRGIGRFQNPSYCEFLAIFEKAGQTRTEQLLNKLTLYSFNSPWPEQFDVRNFSSHLAKSKLVCSKRSTNLPVVFTPLIWLVAHTVGIRLAYPGCTWFLNSVTFYPRIHAIDRLRRLYGIRRVGLRTRDGDFVSAFYADRRGSNPLSSDSSFSGHGDSKGEMLILCCEGNGGYPEIGTTSVPLEQGYSVLAWNHPGFGESTGLPFPEKEQNAVEAVLLFALEHLNFRLDQICLFGWSIGGYTATWAAMNFPEVGGLILDATFDNVDELSKRMLPSIFEPMVEAVVKNYLDLNNLAQAITYDGPILLIRRSEDEVISVGENPSRATNRGNFLLIGLLKHRYPHLFTPENESFLTYYLSLSGQEQVDMLADLNCTADHYGPLVSQYLLDEVFGKQTLADGVNTPAVSLPKTGLFPSNLGSQIVQMNEKRNILLYLVSQYHIESHGTHCTPLSPDCFRLPWSPISPVHSSTSSTLAPNATINTQPNIGFSSP